MCPNREILSVYVDNELPSPFKEKIEAHIAGCPACAGTIADFRRLSQRLDLNLDTNKLNTAGTRLWEKIETAARFYEDERSVTAQRRRRFSSKLWARQVHLPLPVAAAACIAVLAAFTVLLGRGGGVEERQLAGELRAEDMLINLPDEIDLENNTSETVNISNMNDVLQFLENDGDSNIVIIKLPESKSFNRYGEPRLLNASEHPRRMMER